MERADVVVIGAGMAGLSAALTLCTASNLAVMIVEREEIGANQGIRAVFSEAVEEFDLHDSVLQKYATFVWDSPLGISARFDYKQTALAALDYQKACMALYERAACAGLELRRARAIGWSPEVPDATNPLVVHLDNGDSVRTEVLVDATGFAQWAATRLRIAQSKYSSICYGELLTGSPITDASGFTFLVPHSEYGNGGGWFYPAGENVASVGYSVVVPRAEQGLPRAKQGYLAAKRGFQPYADWIEDASRERMECGMIPVGRIGRFADHRILIIGDAAGQAHPWSVEGCRPALVNGQTCARTIMRAFERKRFDRSTLSLFERQWAKSNYERFWRTASIAEIVWSRTDQEWQQFTQAYRQLPSEQQLAYLRDNRVPLFHQIYAVGGYMRRLLMKWIRAPRI